MTHFQHTRKDSGLQIVDLPQKDSQVSSYSYSSSLERNKREVFQDVNNGGD